MTTETDIDAMRILCDLVEKQCGLSFPDRQLPALVPKVQPVLDALGVSTLQDAAERVSQSSASLLPEVMQALTIGETYFFRNRAQFDALQDTILPTAIADLGKHEPLVIWSAGCATGEEPYSLAMWVRERARHLWPQRLRIIATDINQDFLAKAREGVYREWSLRHVDDFWRQRYFTVDGPFLHVDPTLKEVIQFNPHNLVSGILPAGIGPSEAHLVLCRNVLIYFLPQRSARVLEMFQRALNPDGVLVLGHAEHLPTLKAWRSTYHQGTYTYQPPKAGAAHRSPTVAETAAAQTAAHRTTGPARDTADRGKDREPPSAPPATPRFDGSARPSPQQADTSQAAAKVSVSVASSPAPVPTNEGCALQQARQAADAGDLKTARDLLDAYTSHHRTSTEAHFLTAVVSEQLSDWDGARAALKRTLFLEKTLVVGHYLLAVISEREGVFGEALRRYRTVCRLLTNEKDDALLPLGDGLTAGRLRELSEARSAELDAKHG